MDRNDEWSAFLDNMQQCAVHQLQATQEYIYRRQREEQLDELLTNNTTSGQKELIDEVLFSLGLASEREGQLLYRQGVQDGVWLLKNLGVLP